MKLSAWLLRRRALSKKAEEAASSRQEEGEARIGITTRIEIADPVKTVTIRYRFKARVNRFTTATKQDKMRLMMANSNQATLMVNLRPATRIKEEIEEDVATKTETIRNRMIIEGVLVAMVVMGVAAEEKVVVDVGVVANK